MATKISSPLIDDVVERCVAANNPVPGIFWLAQINVDSTTVNSSLWPATQTLLQLLLKDPCAAFVLHDNEAIRQAVKSIGVEIVNDGMDKSLWAMCAPSYGLDTGIKPAAWSVIGWLTHCKDHATDVEEFLTDAAPILGGLPGLKEPDRMPVHESLILPRGTAEPLGQWVPAFRDSKGRSHDLLDLTSVTCQSANFSMLSRVFSSFSRENSEAKGGYLARQAARVYDIAVNEIMPKDFEKTQRHDMPIHFKTAYTGLTSWCHPLIGQALIQGAKLTQEAWSGPKQGINRRPFETRNGDLRGLVYTVIGAKANNETDRSETFKRMVKEGHDVVIAHRDHPETDKKHAELPLHMCVYYGFSDSVKTLLSLGADTKAVEHVNGKDRSLMDAINPLSTHVEEIKAAIRSCDARQAAFDAIEEMQLKEVRAPMPQQ